MKFVSIYVILAWVEPYTTDSVPLPNILPLSLPDPDFYSITLSCYLSWLLISALIPLPSKPNLDTMSTSLISMHILCIPSVCVSDESSFFFASTLLLDLISTYPIPASVINYSKSGLISYAPLLEIVLFPAASKFIPLNLFGVALMKYLYNPSPILSYSSRVSTISRYLATSIFQRLVFPYFWTSRRRVFLLRPLYHFPMEGVCISYTYVRRFICLVLLYFHL